MKITQLQREAKAAFWKRASDNPLLVPDKIRDADIRRLSPGGESLPLGYIEFREWFLDKDRHEVLLTAGREAALQKLIDKVNVPEDRVGQKGEISHVAQINAAKVLLDKAGIGEEKIIVSDSQINDMSDEELENYIASKRVKQPKLKAVDNGKES